MVANGHATLAPASDFDRFATALRETRATAESKRLDLASVEDRAGRLEGDFKLAAIRQYADPTLADHVDAAIADLRLYLGQEADAKRQIRALQVQADDAKSMAQISGAIDGKNAEIRAAQLAQVLRSDPEYQRIQREIADAENRLADAQGNGKVAQARLDAAKALIRQGTAVLEFLAS